MLNKTLTVQIVKQVSLQRYAEKHVSLREFQTHKFRGTIKALYKLLLYYYTKNLHMNRIAFHQGT